MKIPTIKGASVAVLTSVRDLAGTLLNRLLVSDPPPDQAAATGQKARPRAKDPPKHKGRRGANKARPVGAGSAAPVGSNAQDDSGRGAQDDSDRRDADTKSHGAETSSEQELMAEISQALSQEGPAPHDFPARPLQEPPLCIELPPQWCDDFHYRLRPFAYAGATCQPTQFGVIAVTLRANEMIAQNYDEPFAHGYFGPPDSGKSYVEGVHIESALVHNRYQTQLVTPLCAISLTQSRHQGESHGEKQLYSRFPNQDPDEVRRLIREHGTLPQGIEDIVAVTLDGKAPALHRRHPHCRVMGLKFSCGELGIEGLTALMGMEGIDDTLLSEEVADMLGTLPRGFTKQDLLRAVSLYNFRNDHLRDIVRRRVRLACRYIDDRVSLRALIKSGRHIVIDIQDGWLKQEMAMRLFRIVLSILVLGEGEPPCGLLVVYDEAHHFLANKLNRAQMEHIIKERRHLRTSSILSSQDPTKVPHSTLAELDGVGLFPMGSEKSLHHLGADIDAFKVLTPGLCKSLGKGQMFFYSRHWFTPSRPGELEGGLLRVQVRTRMAHHGGHTKKAV